MELKMKSRRLIIEILIFIVLPISLLIFFSVINEMLYFKGIAFWYPLYFGVSIVYFRIKYNMKGMSLAILGISIGIQYAYGVIFYIYQQIQFDKYCKLNNQPLDLDGFIPFLIALTVNCFIYFIFFIIYIGIGIYLKHKKI